MSVRAVIISGKQQGDFYLQDSGSLYFRRRVNYKDFSTAGTTASLDVLQPNPWTHFPAGLEIEGAGISFMANFVGGGNASATLTVGTTGSVAAYVTSSNVFTGAYKTFAGVDLPPFTFLGGTTSAAATGDATVRVQLITSVNTNLLTAGVADIYLKLRAVSLRLS